MSVYPQVGLFECHSSNFDSLSNDVHLIQQTLQGWTSIFSQLMEISIETHKQNQSNSMLLQQIMTSLQRRSKQSQTKDQIKLSPIKPTQIEPEEIAKLENFSKIFNNPKKISIMQFQGTPFDSAYESINKELEEPSRDDEYLSVPKTIQFSNDKNIQFSNDKNIQLSNDKNKQKQKNQQIELHPQSAKNTYENKQFAFNKPTRQQDIKSNKENNINLYHNTRPDSRKNQDNPQLSTVHKHNHSPQIAPFDNNFRFQSHRQCDQNSTSKNSQNSQRPLNYFLQQQQLQLQSEYNRSSSKSCYGANTNLQHQILTNNINLLNSQQPFQQQSINQSTRNMKQQNIQNNHHPIKQQSMDIANQIQTQRAKSFSEQNYKKQLSKRCLDIELFDKQYETSQELIWKAQKNKK